MSFVCERESVGKAYFARVMWYIGSIVVSADEQLRGGDEGGGSLEAMLDNHLDHWTYLNDILELRQWALSELLLTTASAKLLEPLYLASYLELWEGQGEELGEGKEVCLRSGMCPAVLVTAQKWLLPALLTLASPPPPPSGVSATHLPTARHLLPGTGAVLAGL